jgi:DNA gyrase subunit A
MEIDTYRQQRRGGKGITGMITREEDYVENVFVANMHDYLLCFTNNGRAYWLKVYDVPESARISRGKAIVNLLNLQGERVTNIIPIRDFSPDRYLFFATRKGVVAKIPQDEFSNPRTTGIIAITIRGDDELVDVKVTDGHREVILTTKYGRGLRFSEETVTPHGRGVQGVRGMKLMDDDTVKALTVIEKEHLFVVTDVGYGKRTAFDEFMGHGRGTLGVKNIKTDRNESVVTAKSVAENEELVVMSASGIVMRTKVSGVSIQGRNTQGVRIMKLNEGDRVVGVAVVHPEEEEGDSSSDEMQPQREGEKPGE